MSRGTPRIRGHLFSRRKPIYASTKHVRSLSFREVRLVYASHLFSRKHVPRKQVATPYSARS